MSRGHLPVDLHLHSSASDGLLSPAELIKEAAFGGLAAVALTDHDTMAGIGEACAAGQRCGLEVIAGVELSVSTGEQREIHLLGYDPRHPEIINDILEQLRRERFNRMEKIASRLQKIGFSLTAGEIAAEAKPAAPGRLHLARLMVKRGYCRGTGEAFARYLSRGRPAYLPRKTLQPAAAIDLLHRAGAVPVVAHPGAAGRAHLPDLVAMGLRGIEVYHPDHSPELIRYYRHQAERLGLLITGGSDFHGDAGHRRVRPGEITVPYRYLSALKSAPRGL